LDDLTPSNRLGNASVIDAAPTLAPRTDREASTDQTVAFVTLGCKTNLLESSALAEAFGGLGWHVVSQDDPAALYVFNTCTVTERADAEARRLIRKLRRQQPGARIAVTGCYAQVAPQELAAIDGVDFVIGNNLKNQLAQLVAVDHAQYRSPWPNEAMVLVDEFEKSRELATATGSAAGMGKLGHSRTRGALKIQDGCDYKCTYCIIWQGRGPSRSLPLAVALGEVRRLVAQGFEEISLTGINIGQYLDEATQTDLAGLIRAISGLEGQFRVRLTSLDPLEVTQDLITAVAESGGKVCPHFHLSTQSAHDGVLKAMARRHHEADLWQVCQAIVHAMPHAHIASDIIVGFPTETPEAFEHTYDQLATLPMHTMHVFRYSPRPGTPAATLRPQVPHIQRKQRAQRLMALATEKRAAFYAQWVGHVRPVLVEGPDACKDSTTLSGWTDNYCRVRLSGAAALAVPGDIVPVQLTGFETQGDDSYLVGQIV
jgi:threonylcarbamoyladenosine tRNA methylthiotransferase MtaB